MRRTYPQLTSNQFDPRDSSWKCLLLLSLPSVPPTWAPPACASNDGHHRTANTRPASFRATPPNAPRVVAGPVHALVSKFKHRLPELFDINGMSFLPNLGTQNRLQPRDVHALDRLRSCSGIPRLGRRRPPPNRRSSMSTRHQALSSRLR